MLIEIETSSLNLLKEFDWLYFFKFFLFIMLIKFMNFIIMKKYYR